MNRRHDVALTRGWVQLGTQRLVRAVEGLDEAALAGAGLLPGWSRAHVVAHVARNAEALSRLATWARTGVETPMYPDRATRDAEIDRSAAQGAAALREDLVTTAAALERDLDALDGPAWGATVVAGQGRAVRASVLPWLRVREVWLHAADLAAGASLTGTADPAPDDLVDELLTDVAATVSGTDGCPPVLLVPDDRDGTLALGGLEGEPDAPVSVRGHAAALLLWVAGRGPGQGDERVATTDGSPLPDLPGWL